MPRWLSSGDRRQVVASESIESIKPPLNDLVRIGAKRVNDRRSDADVQSQQQRSPNAPCLSLHVEREKERGSQADRSQNGHQDQQDAGNVVQEVQNSSDGFGVVQAGAWAMSQQTPRDPPSHVERTDQPERIQVHRQPHPETASGQPKARS